MTPPARVATIDMYVGTNGFRRVDVEVRPKYDGGLHVEVEVPTALAQPVMLFIAALRAGRAP